LVSKLRENNKIVIGVGVKKSTSDLLILNCDEFIFYDDLVREEARRKPAKKKPVSKTSPNPNIKPAEKEEQKKQEALSLVVETVQALSAERGEEEKIWGSMVKQAIKRRKPGFNESYYGFQSFGKVLEEAELRQLLVLQRDEKSGGYIITSFSQD
ncbi:MAG: NYN domain-containing protein, partial [Chlorobiales bacterium]|nr:NYN domain-containing protein [Chlorobiales bacterium]